MAKQRKENKKYKCAICGQEFAVSTHISRMHKMSPQEYYIKYIDSRTTCSNPKCDKPVRFKSLSEGFSQYCSNKCAANTIDQEKRMKKLKENNLKKYGTEHYFQTEQFKKDYKETCLEKYGVDNVKKVKEINEKSKRTNIEKYGAENPMQNVKVRKKAIKTNIEKYGGNSPSCSPIIIRKKEKTCIKNRGCAYPSQSTEVKEKMKKTCFEKYGVENPIQNEDIVDKMKQTCFEKYGTTNARLSHYKNYDKLNKEFWLENFIENNLLLIDDICKFYNMSITSLYNYKEKWNITNSNKCNKSRIQQEIFDFIEAEEKLFNDRKILDGFELDIVVPSHKFAIEFDGLMFHSYGKSKYSMFNNFGEENQTYHLRKTEDVEERGFQLFHIFENEWQDDTKREIWKSMINNKLNKNIKTIFARKCKIYDISDNNKLVDKFLEENHLQGKCAASIKYGLFFENKLVSLMTFGKNRFSNKSEWELIRFCTKINHRVVGGASKLLKHFERIQSPKSIISYANRRWSMGGLYESLGFKLNNVASPNYFYFHEENIMKLYSRVNFQKHKLKNKLELFDKDLTETLNMYINGYRKIYDSGNLVYLKTF